MGACISDVREEIIVRRFAPHGADAKAFALSRKVEREMERAQERNRNVSKLLLLGSGNSGKSTVMKQFKLFLRNGFSMEERRVFRDVIWRSAIETMRILAQTTQDLTANAEDEKTNGKEPDSGRSMHSAQGGAGSLDEFALMDAERPDNVSVRSIGRDTMRSYILFLLQRVRDDQPLWEEVQVPVATRDDGAVSSEEEEDGMSARPSAENGRISTPHLAPPGDMSDADEVTITLNARHVKSKRGSKNRKRKKKNAPPVIYWEKMTVGRLLQKIWWDSTTQLVFAREEQFFEAPLGYFMSNMDRIARADYHPTNDDILLARKRTNGVNILEFEKDGRKFVLMDVGGQKTERRKWLAHFDNVRFFFFSAMLHLFSSLSLLILQSLTCAYAKQTPKNRWTLLSL